MTAQYTIPLPPRPSNQPAPPQTIDAPDYTSSPCPFLPGTSERIEVYAARHAAGRPLFVAGDAQVGDRQGYLPADGVRLGSGTSIACAGEELPGGAGLRPISRITESRNGPRLPSHTKSLGDKPRYRDSEKKIAKYRHPSRLRHIPVSDQGRAA
jgi:hypothetical protein